MITLTRTQIGKIYPWISQNTWKRRKSDLLDYLGDYFIIVEYQDEGNGYWKYDIDVKSISDLPKIPSMPRKNNIEEKRNDYNDYTVAALGNEYKPNSKAFITRNAIAEFGMDKYNHINEQAVCQRYVGPVMQEKGEKSDKMVWVYYSNYEPVSEEALEVWFKILKEEHMTTEEMANAWIKEQQGLSVEREKSYYKRAIDKFKKEYGDLPIKVYKWRLKREA